MRLYLSYRRTDHRQVAAIADALEKLGQGVWWDALLRPGVAFEQQLAANLDNADVFIAFVSRQSVGGIQQPHEVRLAIETGKPLLTVRLDNVRPEALPFDLSGTWIDASADRSGEESARQIVAALPALSSSRSETSPSPDEVRDLAAWLRKEAEAPEDAGAQGNSRAVFIVHGHDDAMMADVTNFLREQGLEPIVLKKLKGGQNTLFDKFRAVGGEARFAVILMSADDFGSSVGEYEEHNAGERALLYRARQNVILETGFFFGKLGWDNVFVLMKPPPRKIPRFERPSDLDGVIFEAYDERAEWKAFLSDQLRARGLL